MEDIVELYAGPEVGINHGLHNLPEHLQEANTPGVCVTFGYQYQYGLPQFLQDLPGTSQVLEYSMICIHLLGLGGGGGCSLSRIGLVKTRNELLQVEVGVTDCLVGEEVLDRFLHLYLCWDLIANLEGVTMVY